MRISRGILRGALPAVKQGGSAGRRPAPAVVPAAGRQPQKQQRAFRGMEGVGPVAGAAASTSCSRSTPCVDAPR
ncbi:hypothetical protein E5C33_19300 [Stenotrophomonas maltophilia]|nr:hypothetical protein E5C33_19300 [Stenotrophomonas maltophilia]